jgi:hypothetical protein
MKKKRTKWSSLVTYSALLLLVCAGVVSIVYALAPTSSFVRGIEYPTLHLKPPQLDKEAYDKKLLEMSHVTPTSPWYHAYLAATTTPLDERGNATTTTEARPLWPVRTAYPKYGALLPFNRIIAYYGNFYSRAMGALGEYDEDEMLARLEAEVAAWEAADPATPAVPAIHYIVVTAQASAGRDGKYRARMPDDQVDKALALAERVGGVVFLDFQVGFSDVQTELPQYEKYYALPNVHIGIDPEFSMKGSASPGHVIGVYDAADINWVSEYLAGIVQEHDLPPKVLIIHRFTRDMVTNYRDIQPLPEVQIVMHMDGWGSPQRKFNTYRHVIAPEPVQFTGFKIFYKNDLKEIPPRLLTPAELLELTPAPVYIQYQ